MKKPVILSLCLLSSHAFAIDCYITVMQGTCWKNYDITITALDAMSSEPIASPITLSGKNPNKLNDFWKRIPFKCKPKQGIKFQATFSPPIWENNKGKAYPSVETIYLPETIDKGIFAWNIPICYPKGFDNVPIPPAYSGTECNCDDIKKVIPKLEKPKS